MAVFGASFQDEFLGGAPTIDMSDPKKLFNNLWLAITAGADAGSKKMETIHSYSLIINHVFSAFISFFDFSRRLRDETASIYLDPSTDDLTAESS